MAKEFAQSVAVDGPAGRIDVGSAQQAYDMLSDPSWPERGPAHEEAVETALKVLDGHRSTVDSHDTFVRAAKEAGILAKT